MDRLRERMRGLGFSYDEIAIEVSRRYPVCPRQAYRLAWGWTLDKVAERFNELAALADHESLRQHDRLVLMRRLRAETPFGERVLVLAEERGNP